MVIREAKSAEPLNTDLPQIVEKVAAQQNGEVYEPKEELPIGDAAILMAQTATVKVRSQNAGRTVCRDKDFRDKS